MKHIIDFDQIIMRPNIVNIAYKVTKNVFFKHVAATLKFCRIHCIKKHQHNADHYVLQSEM